MIRKSVIGLALFLLAVPLLADNKLDDRMMHAASIIHEIRGSLDEEAPGVLGNAYAVAVFPEFVKVGLLGGVRHGRGVLAKRLPSGDWSKPAFVRITSGSLGLQFGVSISQLLIVFKDPKAVEAISGGQFTIGADAGYAAGELGGMAGAGTDSRFRNEIVAVARSKGLFAGVALEGGVLRIEKDSNVEFYDSAIGLDGRTLLEDIEVEMPAVAQHFRIVLAESIPPLAEGERPMSADNAKIDIDINRPKAGGAESSAKQANSSPAGSGGGAQPQAGPAKAKGVEPPAGAQPPSVQAYTNTAPAPRPEEVAEGTWVKPDGQAFASADRPRATRAYEYRNSGGDSRVADKVADKLAGKVAGALWDGAVELGKNALRNDPETQTAKAAASAGGKLVEAVLPKPGAPKPKKPTAPSTKPAAPAPNSTAPDSRLAAYAPKPASQWVEIPEAEPQQLASYMREGAAGKTGSITPRSLRRAAGAASDAGFTGPPPPSEWPQEWLLQQAAGGACVQVQGS
ncbi:MAG: YSC84-related protein [Gammaproteobacteria bacterium]|nr:YSC84-related protein [Gammaproteobacteria bacterium]MCY4164560.1 YSC84-related protein [Gammaproteobacteria bacterium]MCY4339789.1 YSC84-related protein [Gammaproteobacteria bacterium]